MKNLYNIDDWTEISPLRVGEILLESGKINLIHLSMALDIQKFHKLPIGEIFLSMNVVNEKDIHQALHIQKMLKKRHNDV